MEVHAVVESEPTTTLHLEVEEVGAVFVVFVEAFLVMVVEEVVVEPVVFHFQAEAREEAWNVVALDEKVVFLLSYQT